MLLFIIINLCGIWNWVILNEVLYEVTENTSFGLTMPLKTVRHPTRWRPKLQSQSLISHIGSQRVSQRVWFRRLPPKIFFFFRQLPCLGGYWLQIIFFQSWESWYATVLNTLTFESEKLSGEGFQNKSKVPIYPTSRNLLCSHEKQVSARRVGREQINVGFFLHDYTVHEQFFILNLPELTFKICSCCLYLKIFDFNGAFKRLSLEICLNRIRRERLE